jgi:hypothetical protein
MTALKEGTPIRRSGATAFTFVADGAPDFQIPTIQITYTILGDSLTIDGALVWQESDHEDDSAKR